MGSRILWRGRHKKEKQRKGELKDPLRRGGVRVEGQKTPERLLTQLYQKRESGEML